jgi:hypothetical protein
MDNPSINNVKKSQCAQGNAGYAALAEVDSAPALQ